MLLDQRDAHVNYVADERRHHWMKTELAKGDPVDYLSVDIDGAEKIVTDCHLSVITQIMTVETALLYI